MDFKQLEAFVSVFNLKSFSRAAEKLYLSQPAISNQISSLERELETKLFIRTAREIVPTKDGRAFYRYAKEILEKKEQAVQAIQDIQNPSSDVITIAASHIPLRHFLPQLLAAFQKRYRNVSFRVNGAHSVQVVQSILDGKADIGLTDLYVPASQCDIRAVTCDRRVIITPNNARYRHLITSGEFSLAVMMQERFICREPEEGIRKELSAYLKHHGIDPTELRIVAEVNDTETIVQMVAHGLGIAVVSKGAAERFQKSGMVLASSLSEEFPSQKVYLVRNNSITLSTIAWKFHNFAQKYYADTL